MTIAVNYNDIAEGIAFTQTKLVQQVCLTVL